ncbi:MAG: outer membrane beta-barrel protein [Gemmatimonadales bacterium]
MRRSYELVRFRLQPIGALLYGALWLGAFSAPTDAHAQAARAGGVWWSGSVAAAGARLACDVCDPTRDAGPAVEVAAGTYASPSVRVGLDGGAWTFRDDDFRETVYTVGAVTEVYPRAGSGLHVIAGLGWTGYRANDVDAPDDQLGFHYNALRLRVGAGWDFPLTSGWSVGNRVTLDASSLGTLSDEGQPIATSVGLSLVRFGIYLRYR